MLFGFDSFARFPFATVSDDNNTSISTGTNALTLSIGNVGIIGHSIVQIASPDELILNCPGVTVITSSLLALSAMPLLLNSANAPASGSAVVQASLNNLTLASNITTVTGGAVVSPDPNALTCNVSDVGIITWNPIDPGPTNVWVPIKPY